ncbi:hypothetical protein [Chamaesiphon minutus]|uniref:Uncharacterized protein n=1 Tax=Chamaesiphon minutus (strain ATCC 27169 / PCC 6605) TaxID=1173020 RepID=K9UHJ8_CHAP6|nr:hypothetical protein [Chamaesiphon minutus]AFY93921.1 hypothetical protein Cha6605_2887 [Chamaesiphon minutus PCC 6605]
MGAALHPKRSTGDECNDDRTAAAALAPPKIESPLGELLQAS